MNRRSPEKNFWRRFFWRTLAPVSLASRGSVLGKAVLGLESSTPPLAITHVQTGVQNVCFMLRIAKPSNDCFVFRESFFQMYLNKFGEYFAQSACKCISSVLIGVVIIMMKLFSPNSITTQKLSVYLFFIHEIKNTDSTEIGFTNWASARTLSKSTSWFCSLHLTVSHQLFNPFFAFDVDQADPCNSNSRIDYFPLAT